jgi:hypothetical protein
MCMDPEQQCSYNAVRHELYSHRLLAHTGCSVPPCLLVLQSSPSFKLLCCGTCMTLSPARSSAGIGKRCSKVEQGLSKV